MLPGREGTSGRRRESERLATTMPMSTHVYSIHLESNGRTANLFGRGMIMRGKVSKAVQPNC